MSAVAASHVSTQKPKSKWPETMLGKTLDMLKEMNVWAATQGEWYVIGG